MSRFIKPFLCSAYYPGRIEVVADVGGPSLTRQEFHDECDINVLMGRYERTGLLPVHPGEPRYMDCVSVPNDFRMVMDFMIEAEKSFMTLPAHVRKDFDNDPRAFVDFAGDPKNLDQMRKWGLAPDPVVPAGPIRVEVVPGAVPEKPLPEPPKAP